MGETTGIEWTDHTFNPWIGCAKVSPGCENCYAERDMDHRRGRVKWGIGGTRSRTSEAYWKQPFAWAKKAKAEGVRRRVFCASLADVFEDRPDLEVWRDDLFQVISETPELDWLLLTKRPENIVRMMNPAPTESVPVPCLGGGDYFPNVWLGTSVEDAKRTSRIDVLRTIPASVRFLSCEPMCGPLNDLNLEGIHWVICGGESGPGARQMPVGWARGLRDQCLAAGVPFFFKQWGEFNEVGERVGKKVAGKLLDGIIHHAFPETVHAE